MRLRHLPAGCKAGSRISPRREPAALDLDLSRGTGRSVSSRYFLRTLRSVNCAVSERLARGVFAKTITPEVSLSSRWMIASFAHRASRCRSQS